MTLHRLMALVFLSACTQTSHSASHTGSAHNKSDVVSSPPKSHTPTTVPVAAVTETGDAKISTTRSRPSYPLDNFSREIQPHGRVKCPEVKTTRYKGDVVRYHKPIKVYVGFERKLRRFEELLRQTALEFYGRAPKRTRHYGAFYCRRIAAWPHLVSEHGLGNALDVAGFDFAPLKRKDAPKITGRLRRGFEVRVKKHWNGRGKTGSVHARFLRKLAQRVIDEPNLFRVILGPAEPGHADHFHFDMAPWRIVNVF